MHFESIMRLGKVVLISRIVVDEKLMFDETINEQTKKEIREFLVDHSNLVEELCEAGCHIAWVEVDRADHEKDPQFLLEKYSKTVDQAVEFLRLRSYRFDIREMLIGSAGLVANKKIGFIKRTNNDIIELIEGEQVLYNIQPGLGPDVSYYCPQYEDLELYNTLFSGREDEVYLEYRTILSRVCEAMQLADINRTFCHLFSTIERMSSREYKKFQIRKKTVISWISKNQNEYNYLNKALFFLSKKIRTEVVHKGKDISSIVSIRDAYGYIQTMFSVIMRFSLKCIQSEIESFSDLEIEFENSKLNFEKPSSTNVEFRLLEEEQGDDEFPQRIFALPISEFNLNNVEVLGPNILIPKNYSGDFSELQDSELFISKELLTNFLRIPSTLKLNERAAINVFIDYYKVTGTWNCDKEFEFLDQLAIKAERAMDYIILNKCSINKKHELPAHTGILEGYRIGVMSSLELNDAREMLGKVYTMYPKLPIKFSVDIATLKLNEKVEFELMFSDRTDEVYLVCRTALARVCQAMYMNDLTASIAFMFDTLDMLATNDINMDGIRSNVLPFISKVKSDYHTIGDSIKVLNELYRTPILHHGKSIFELVRNNEEVHNVFNQLMDIIVQYSTNVIRLGIQSYNDLDIEKDKKKQILGIC